LCIHPLGENIFAVAAREVVVGCGNHEAVEILDHILDFAYGMLVHTHVDPRSLSGSRTFDLVIQIASHWRHGFVVEYVG
jgi:hypothetical protein